MGLALTAFNQIIVMFILLLIGMLCYKINLIDKEMSKKLSDVVLLLVNPMVILISYQRKFEATLLSGLLISLGLALATHLVAILVSIILLRKKSSDLAIERFSVIYSNCGFIGIPIVNGIFGSEGVFYLTAYMTIFNLVVWTHGMVSISGKYDKKSIIKAILSPAVISVFVGFLLFVCRIKLPMIIGKPISYIADMNTPLAMLVAGVTIAQTNIIKIFGRIRAFYISLIKLIIIPIGMLLLFHMFDIPKIILLTAVLATACPTGATINLFSLRYDKNYIYASELFAITTILSLITIPFVMIVANLIL
jgi:Predicted permeases